MAAVSAIALFLAVSIACVNAQHGASKSKVCANVFCGAGRECSVSDKGEPSCLCIAECKSHKRPVCGSNGKTYRNHCELHRDACLTGTKIQPAADGACQERTDDSASSVSLPVVCSQGDRNGLRGRLVEWLRSETVSGGWFTAGSDYRTVLNNYFEGTAGVDKALDSTELLQLIQQNPAVSTMSSQPAEEPGHGQLLRGLCVDALIELRTADTDWKLGFEEFLDLLNPNYTPPERSVPWRMSGTATAPSPWWTATAASAPAATGSAPP
uniref:LOW QUALITY PROTEIN: follistatin-related protein 1 n=1 Tax=Petromyzon marinus TaxID=7757 RepID=A0AAJ7XFP7_PETMA|nr:LOW QUALITY PROTEIN: follistatin-related protein 1 [Petromyzon marinus]